MIQQPNRVPVIGQREAAARAAVSQAVQQLSMQIYAKLAVKSIDECDGARVTQLQTRAREAHKAAQAYFQGLGIAQFDTASTEEKKE